MTPRKRPVLSSGAPASSTDALTPAQAVACFNAALDAGIRRRAAAPPVAPPKSVRDLKYVD
jgi:hypothetical protein